MHGALGILPDRFPYQQKAKPLCGTIFTRLRAKMT